MNQDPYTPPASEPLPTPQYRLWNPRVAAALSVVFTPAFGAIIHALNWRCLGKPALATANWLWAAGVIVFLLVLIFVPAIQIPQQLNTPISLGILLGWFYAVGKRQVDAVQALGSPNGYQKRSWLVPVAAGLAAIAALVGFIYWAVAASMTPEAMAAELKPLVEKAWKNNVGDGTATVEKVDLQGDGKSFSGTVSGSLNSEPVTVPIRATLGADGTIEWKTGN